MGLLGNFFRWNRGSIGVIGTVFLGVNVVLAGGVIEYVQFSAAKRQMQHALDEAALAAARTVTRGADNDDPAQRAAARGKNVYLTILKNTDVRHIDARFMLKQQDEVIEASAKAEYDTLFLKMINLDVLEVEVLAHAKVGAVESITAPACFTAWVGGVAVQGSANLDAPECGVAAAAGILVSDGSTMTTALTCPDGACPITDPFESAIGSWITGTGESMGCTAPPTTSASLSPNVRYCDEVVVGDGQTLTLLGGDYYFDGGLRIQANGVVDSTAGSGAAIVIEHDVSLIVEPGGSLKLRPYDAGPHAGMPIVVCSLGSNAQILIEAIAYGLVVLEGLIYARAADVTFHGPSPVEVGPSGLALWSKSLTLDTAVMLPGSEPTGADPLPEISGEGDVSAPYLSQ